MRSKVLYLDYKERLFESLLDKDYKSRFLILIDDLNQQGKTKKEIYHLFLDFHLEIQTDHRTKSKDDIYERLCDFMDGFTDWGKDFKILPNKDI